MTFPVVGSNIPGAYQISNSLRFNDNDSPLLSYTPSSTATDRKKSTISFWFKIGNVTSTFRSLYRFNDGSGTGAVYLRSGNNLQFGWETQTTNLDLNLTAIQRDVSAWYHFFVNYDTTQATASDRVNIYINGVKQTAFGTETYPNLNDTVNHLTNGKTYYIGGDGQSSDKYFDGYIAEFHVIDGQAKAHTDFGEFDEDSGVWKPKQYAGTYGNNGFYLKFNNTGNMGEDSSGNDNTWTPTNLSGTTDVTTDTPTNNFATLNALQTTTSSAELQEGNTNFVVTASGTSLNRNTLATIPFPSSGKWYMETKVTHTNLSSDSGNQVYVGVVQNQANINALSTSNINSISNNGFFSDVRIVGTISDAIQYGTNGSATSYNTNPDWSSGDIIGIAIDMDNGKIYYHLNGTYYNDSGGTAANPSAGTNPNATFTAGMELTYFQSILRYNTSNVEINANFGNPSYSISSGNTDDNGYGNFEYAPPSGYLALCTQNLATALSPTIDDGSQYFNTKLYSGNSTTNPITGVGFAPDFTWLKARNYANAHFLLDTTRGSGQVLFSSSTIGEVDYQGTRWQSFDSDGFTLTGSDSSTNISGGNYVTWNWKANGGTTSSNTDGSITSTVQANTTAGFSIVTYTGTQANATVGHGLGVAPKFIITKVRSSTNGWPVYHYSLSATDFVRLNETAATATNSVVWNNTEPTSTVFTVGANDENNKSGADQLAYCFAEIEGYSKFGSYTGNGSSDGPFIYTGFKPAWIMVKGATTAQVWSMRDNKRDSYNSAQKAIYANRSDAESDNANNSIDLLSNGFKIRNLFGTENQSGQTFIYMAFAENPFVTSGATPVTAR